MLFRSLINDPASTPIRMTTDVDVIAEVATYGQYANLGERLRGLGFLEDGSEGAPICRWVAGGLKLDVMPTLECVLGFANRWYADAIRQSLSHQLAPDLAIRVVTGPYFLATKFEAFLTRGRGDYYESHDLEDLIAVLDGRRELVDEVHAAADDVRGFLAERFAKLVGDPRFMESLPGQFLPDDVSQKRSGVVLARMRAIAKDSAPSRQTHAAG